MVLEKSAPKTRDYLAELYVAGLMGDRGWSIYFPKRDDGFDFISTKAAPSGLIMRPVQVKGLYPTLGKVDKQTYGWRGRLSQTHPDMALVLSFFSPDEKTMAPDHLAFIPFASIRPTTSGEWRSHPAIFKSGRAMPRRHYRPFFGASGLDAMEEKSWSQLTVTK
jgi:hypothetical protein